MLLPEIIKGHQTSTRKHNVDAKIYTTSWKESKEQQMTQSSFVEHYIV